MPHNTVEISDTVNLTFCLNQMNPRLVRGSLIFKSLL